MNLMIRLSEHCLCLTMRSQTSNDLSMEFLWSKFIQKGDGLSSLRETNFLFPQLKLIVVENCILAKIHFMQEGKLFLARKMEKKSPNLIV